MMKKLADMPSRIPHPAPSRIPPFPMKVKAGIGRNILSPSAIPSPPSVYPHTDNTFENNEAFAAASTPSPPVVFPPRLKEAMVSTPTSSHSTGSLAKLARMVPTPTSSHSSSSAAAQVAAAPEPLTPPSAKKKFAAEAGYFAPPPSKSPLKSQKSELTGSPKPGWNSTESAHKYKATADMTLPTSSSPAMEKSRNTLLAAQEVLKKSQVTIQSFFKEHSVHIQGTFEERSGNMLGYPVCGCSIPSVWVF
jgi:hypothetical protein